MIVMTQEEKELLAKDIFGRVLTGLKVNYNGEIFTLGYNLYLEDGDTAFESYPMKFYLEGVETIKPYLRPMSSMNDEEEGRYNLCQAMAHTISEEHWTANDGNVWKYSDAIDYLNEHHFDYRGLIEKGLALEAPEDMYNDKF